MEKIVRYCFASIVIGLTACQSTPAPKEESKNQYQDAPITNTKLHLIEKQQKEFKDLLALNDELTIKKIESFILKYQSTDYAQLVSKARLLMSKKEETRKLFLMPSDLRATAGTDFKKIYKAWLSPIKRENLIPLNGLNSKTISKVMVNELESYCKSIGLDSTTKEGWHGNLMMNKMDRYTVTCGNSDGFVGSISFYDFESYIKVYYSTLESRLRTQKEKDKFIVDSKLNGSSGYIINDDFEKVPFTRIGSLDKRVIVGIESPDGFIESTKIKKIAFSGVDIRVTTNNDKEYKLNIGEFRHMQAYNTFSSFGCCESGFPLVHLNNMSGKYTEKIYPNFVGIKAIHFDSNNTDKLITLNGEAKKEKVKETPPSYSKKSYKPPVIKKEKLMKISNSSFNNFYIRGDINDTVIATYTKPISYKGEMNCQPSGKNTVCRSANLVFTIFASCGVDDITGESKQNRDGVNLLCSN